MMEEEGPGIAKNLVEKFGVAQDLAKIAQKYPKLASAWNVMMAGTKAATRAGAEQGGQTFVKTGGDVEATKEATRTAAEWGGVLGAGAKQPARPPPLSDPAAWHPEPSQEPALRRTRRPGNRFSATWRM